MPEQLRLLDLYLCHPSIVIVQNITNTRLWHSGSRHSALNGEVRAEALRVQIDSVGPDEVTRLLQLQGSETWNGSGMFSSDAYLANSKRKVPSTQL